MGHQHGGHAHLFVQAAQPLSQVVADLGVERAERFVEQQHLRIDRQCPGQRHTLALTTGKLCRVTLLETGEPDDLE